MCQVAVLSRSLSDLSKRSFTQRVDAISGQETRIKTRLTRLNNQLDDLCEQLYDAYSDIVESEYMAIKPYLTLLIDTLKDLYRFYKGHSTDGISDYLCRLQTNISAIEEIDADIRNFKINLYRNPRYQSVVEKAKSFAEL